MLSSVLRNQNKLMTYSSKTEHQRRETTARIVDVWLAQPKGMLQEGARGSNTTTIPTYSPVRKTFKFE